MALWRPIYSKECKKIFLLQRKFEKMIYVVGFVRVNLVFSGKAVSKAVKIESNSPK